MENEALRGRIKFILKELRLRQNDFAKKVGVDVSNLSKYLNGRLPITESLVNRIVINLGVSKQWLMEGTDVPFPKVPEPQQIVVKTPIEAAPPMPSAKGVGTPVYDVDVTAGTASRSMMFAEENIVGWVNLPQSLPDNCRIVRVSGDSMTPVIHNGDYIAVREITNFDQIFWGQIYVILLDDFRLVKFVRRHQDNRMVILRSANTNYDDIEISRSDIRDMMLVQSILHLDVRV